MTRYEQTSVSNRRHPTVASTDPVVVGLGRVLLIVMALLLAAFLAIAFGCLDLGDKMRTSSRQSLEQVDQSLVE